MGWAPERVLMHLLAPEWVAPPGKNVPVRMLREDDSLDHLPPGLRFEMSQARVSGPVAVALVDGLPVSFCYPCWITETLWDVSIDTLEPYRRRGLAAQATQFMIGRMKEAVREPVWAALESNVASLALARQLGFTQVGETVVFSRGPWAYFTRGFSDAQ